jgi:MFS transporter, FHS family, Na+ dependent glucose transporter 1
VLTTLPGAAERRSTSFAYYFVFIGLGLFGGVLGPSLDVFKERSGSSNARIALLFTVTSIGYMVGGAVTGRLFDRRPGHPIIAIALFVAAAMAAVLTQASSLFALGAVMLVIGVATSAVDNGGNTLLTWLHGDDLGPWMIALHAAFGVGSATAALVLALSRRVTSGINGGLVAIAVVAAAGAVVVTRHASPTHLPEDRLGERVAKPSPKRSALLVTASFFFLYVGLEIGFAGWVYTFARDRGFSETNASLLTSVFWWSFTAGRLLGIPVARRLPARSQILLDAAITGVGAGILALSAHSNAVLWLGTVVLGIGLATMFPATMNLANERVAVTGTVMSWFITASGAGGAVMPWLIGRLFDDHGSKILPWFVAAATLAVVVAATFAARLLERSDATRGALRTEDSLAS